MRHLQTRAGRREAGAFAVEGPPAVREAVWHAPKTRTLYATLEALERYTDIVARAREIHVEIMLATEDVIDAMAQTRSPQGIIAVCDLLDGSIDDVVRAGADMAVVLEAASDPGNVGTIIRTADAAGAVGVILTAGSTDPFGSKVVRATAGSIFHLPVADAVDLSVLLARVAVSGMTLAVATGDGECDAFEWLEQGPASICWAFGTEAHGVSDELKAAADVRLHIPLAGRAESLNVGAAVAVCLFADVARRRGRLSPSLEVPTL